MGELERNRKWWGTPLEGIWWALPSVSPSPDPELSPRWGLKQPSETAPPPTLRDGAQDRELTGSKSPAACARHSA